MAEKKRAQQQKVTSRPAAKPAPVEQVGAAPAESIAAAMQRVVGNATPGSAPDDVLTLQRSVGNRAVQQILSRDGQSGRAGSGLAQRQPEGGEAHVDPEEAALQAFLAKGVMPTAAGQDVIGAGGRGGFNAKFDPASRRLIATVNVGIAFHHGLNVNATTGVVTANASGLLASDAGKLASLQNAAASVMLDFPNKVDRINEVNTNWRWTAAEETPWMAQYRSAVTNAWDNQHYFQSRRWSSLLASVRLVVNVHKGAQPGDHCQARIIKSPPSAHLGAYVSHGSGTNKRDQGLFMSSSGTGASATNFLRYSLQFRNNSAALETARGTIHSNDAGPAYLDKFIADFQAGRPTEGTPIRVTGHASSTGNAVYNQKLSERRAKAVEDYLRSHGLTGSIDRVSHLGEGATGATADASWRRVDIVVGSGEAQNTAAHEFGHMIGLGDEYASPAAGFYPGAGTPKPVGDPAAHDALARAMGGGVQGAVAENSDSIMSVGNTVRPQHYATFHKALQEVTGETWQYGGSNQGVELPAVGGPAGDTAVA